MNTRFGRHVGQDLADLSGQEVSGLRISRLAARYEKAIAERKARERADQHEFRLNIPHVAQVQRKISQQLEEDAARINGKLPIASVFDALQIVKAHKLIDRDAGLRALHGHLASMWKRNRTATITASSYLKLHEHYARNFPKSAATDVIVEIGQSGYTTLPRTKLHHIASEIETQDDYDRAMVKYGLSGPQPHQVKSRKYILALLNDEEVDLPFDEGEEEPWEAREEERERHRKRREHPKTKAALKKLAAYIPMDEVEFNVWAEPEDTPVEGAFATGEDELDRELEEKIKRELEAGNEWAWCVAVVQASWTDPESGNTFTGEEYLGACSYDSEEDFKQEGGYYEQMKDEAYEDMLMEVEDADVGMRGIRPARRQAQEGERPFEEGGADPGEAQMGDIDPTILDMMARTFFVSAWADEWEHYENEYDDFEGYDEIVEELGVEPPNFMGVELMSIAPETPQEAMQFAEKFYRDIEQTNNVNLEEFIPPGEDEDFDRHDFGYCLAMEGMGTGVAWSDDHEDHGLNIPQFAGEQMDLAFAGDEELAAFSNKLVETYGTEHDWWSEGEYHGPEKGYRTY